MDTNPATLEHMVTSYDPQGSYGEAILTHNIYGAQVAEGIVRALAMREVSVRFPAEEDTKTFADVRNLLTTPVSARLSKDNGSVHLKKKTYDTKPRKPDIPYKRYTLWNRILIRFTIGGAHHFLLNDIWRHLFYV